MWRWREAIRSAISCSRRGKRNRNMNILSITSQMPPQRAKGLRLAQRLYILMWDHKRALHRHSVSVVHRISLSAWLSRFASVCSRAISSRKADENEQASSHDEAKKQIRGGRAKQARCQGKKASRVLSLFPATDGRSLFHPPNDANEPPSCPGAPPAAALPGWRLL